MVLRIGGQEGPNGSGDRPAPGSAIHAYLLGMYSSCLTETVVTEPTRCKETSRGYQCSSTSLRTKLP